MNIEYPVNHFLELTEMLGGKGINCTPNEKAQLKESLVAVVNALSGADQTLTDCIRQGERNLGSLKFVLQEVVAEAAQDKLEGDPNIAYTQDYTGLCHLVDSVNVARS